MIPRDLRFLSTHEWAKLDEDQGVVTVGLSDFAVEQLGDIVFLELPQTGAAVKKGNAFGAIESVKAASDMYAPVSGKVVEANESLSDNLELFKSDPYGEAWMIKIKVADKEEIEALMDAAGYEAHIQKQQD